MTPNERGYNILPSKDALFILLCVIINLHQLKSVISLTEPKFLLLFPSAAILVAIIYLLFDIIARNQEQIREKDAFKRKMCMLGILILLVGILPGAVRIGLRLQSQPHKFCHDGVVQTEEAMKMILRGKNPYTEDYFQTPMKHWADKWPESTTLTHYVYLPFIFIFPLPFYLTCKVLLRWFDLRLIYLAVYLLTIFLLLKFPRDYSDKMCLVTLFALNPNFLHYLSWGVNDILLIGLLILTIYALKIKNFLLSALSFGLALVTKQFAWLLIPFYLLYLYRFKEKNKTSLMKKVLVILLVVLIFVAPFLAWDYASFKDDVIDFPSGRAKISWPMGGWGIGGTLVALKFVKPTDYFPFWIFYVLLVFPLMIFLLWRQYRYNTLSMVLTGYLITLFIFQYFSRYFHGNYLDYPYTFLLLIIFGDLKK
ncbi:MAG: hypothetical protein QME54_01625 [Actinomycetota bacterium]|nr:hypothetical protein [Actinomycetota bacterium]